MLLIQYIKTKNCCSDALPPPYNIRSANLCGRAREEGEGDWLVLDWITPHSGKAQKMREVERQKGGKDKKTRKRH